MAKAKLRSYVVILALVIAGVAATGARLPATLSEGEGWEGLSQSVALEDRLVAWERQLANRTLPGWPVEHEQLLFAQLVTQELMAFRKQDGALAWWLPLTCNILPGGNVNRPERVLALACLDAVFAVPMDIHGKFHHKKKHLRNDKLWTQAPPPNTTFVAPPLIRQKDVVVVDSKGYIVAHDLMSGSKRYQSKVRVCPVESGTALPLYVASVFQNPLVACVLFDDASRSVAVLNGNTGDVELRFPGPVVPLPTPRPTASPHRGDFEDDQRSPDANDASKEKDIVWTPLVDRLRPLLDLHVAEDDEDGDGAKLHHSTFVWALISDNVRPSRSVVASLEMHDTLPPSPPPGTPRPRPHEVRQFVALSSVGDGDPNDDLRHRHKAEKKVVSVAEYHILAESVGIDGVGQGSRSIKDTPFAKRYVFVTTHCGATVTGCLTANLYDALDLKAGPKVQIALPSEVVLSPGGKQSLGAPQQLTSDTSRLLVLQKVETANASLPQAVLSGFLFDVGANTSEATFTLPLKWDLFEAMNINADIAAVPTPLGVAFLNATSGASEKQLPLLPTKVMPSDVVSDSNCFYFSAGEFLFGIPRLLV